MNIYLQKPRGWTTRSCLPGFIKWRTSEDVKFAWAETRQNFSFHADTWSPASFVRHDWIVVQCAERLYAPRSLLTSFRRRLLVPSSFTNSTERSGVSQQFKPLSWYVRKETSVVTHDIFSFFVSWSCKRTGINECHSGSSFAWIVELNGSSFPSRPPFE